MNKKVECPEFPDHEIGMVVRLWCEGESEETIREKADLSKREVQRILEAIRERKTMGKRPSAVRITTPAISEGKVVQMREMLASGMTKIAVSRELGIRYKTVQRLLKEIR